MISSKGNRLGIKNEHSKHYKMKSLTESTRLFIERNIFFKSVPKITLRDDLNFNKTHDINKQIYKPPPTSPPPSPRPIPLKKRRGGGRKLRKDDG